MIKHGRFNHLQTISMQTSLVSLNSTSDIQWHPCSKSLKMLTCHWQLNSKQLGAPNGQNTQCLRFSDKGLHSTRLSVCKTCRIKIEIDCIILHNQKSAHWVGCWWGYTFGLGILLIKSCGDLKLCYPLQNLQVIGNRLHVDQK